ncbi:hypothetical protein PVAND_014073 [Polypedilum vanderplanki]|uniref:Protein zwilch n=1 Tax=Polypedilum vanderplanki TaxID=319348 RepID=A0A9J6CSL9_POLVA|nr:hypothetical protein PVAND_014073 [Polypedilum vanderplanki]
MSHLTNIYAFLRNNYSNVDIYFNKPLSYIKTITGISNQKIILIYKEDKSKLSLLCSSPKSDAEEKSSDNFSNLNITGSPLRDDNSIDNLINTSIANKLFITKPWNDSEECYTGINIELAQEILSNIANEKFPNGTHGWIFILCGDCSDKSFLLSLYKGNERQFTRGIAKYHGIIKSDEKSMKYLLERHGSLSKTEIDIESIFEINSDLSLRFFNKLSEDASSLNHINKSSDITLYQQIEIGKSHVLCESLWDEIKLLYMIKNDIATAKNNNNSDCSMIDLNYNYGMRTFEKLQESVNNILINVVLSNDIDEEQVDLHLESVLKRAITRPLIDMTDQLWQVLKNASSYLDLKKILTFVFQISSRSCIVNIPTNNNRLSEFIRELSQQRLAVPNLTSTEPLELLLEIGLEKVMKDYEFIYSESKICNLKEIAIGKKPEKKGEEKNITTIRKSLAPNVDLTQNARKTLLRNLDSQESTKDDDYGFYNSRFNEKEADTCISKLAQAHIAIEHILMIQNNLNLEHDYTLFAKKFLENPLMSFEEHQKKKFDRLDVPITDKKVINLVEGLIPNSQKIKIKSEQKYKTFENTFYFNIEQIVPILERKEKEGEIVNKKGDTFHSITYTDIISKF